MLSATMFIKMKIEEAEKLFPAMNNKFTKETIGIGGVNVSTWWIYYNEKYDLYHILLQSTVSFEKPKKTSRSY